MMILLYFTSAIIFFGILYFVIRLGVRDGIQDTKGKEDQFNSVQLSLKKK